MRTTRFVFLFVVVSGAGLLPLPAQPQPLGHWALDGDLLDSEGLNDGVWSGGLEPLFVPGYDGTENGAVYFDGADDYIQIPDNPDAPTLALSDQFTLALWFKAASSFSNFRRSSSFEAAISGFPLTSLSISTEASISMVASKFPANPLRL